VVEVDRMHHVIGRCLAHLCVLLAYRLCYNNIINNLTSPLTGEDLMQYNSKI